MNKFTLIRKKVPLRCWCKCFIHFANYTTFPLQHAESPAIIKGIPVLTKTTWH